jgi:hypothetical protein
MANNNQQDREIISISTKRKIKKNIDEWIMYIWKIINFIIIY